MKNGCPKDIIISDQQLESQGPLRQKRFGNPGFNGHDGKQWDGIHMRGNLAIKHYSSSLIRILNELNPDKSDNYHQKCPQTIYQGQAEQYYHTDRRNHPDYQYQSRRYRNRVYQGHTQSQYQRCENGGYEKNNTRYHGHDAGVWNRFSPLGNC